MKPPVEAPTSSALTSLRVDRERIERVRELDAAASDVRMIRRDELDEGIGRHRCARFRDTWPSTFTWPARINARARSRDAASSRSTTMTSSRALS